MSESPSSPTSLPSTDGLSFILEDDSNDTEMLKCMVDETELKTIQLLMEWRQRTQENMASSSSRRPKKKKRFIRRDREAARDRLYRDYFAQESMYNEVHFHCRFRMRRHLFIRIVDGLSDRYDYFQHRYDGLGRRGLSPLTKCTAAMRMLAYGRDGNRAGIPRPRRGLAPHRGKIPAPTGMGTGTGIEINPRAGMGMGTGVNFHPVPSPFPAL